MFSDQNGITLEINNRKTGRKSPNTWKLNTLLNDRWAKNKVIRKMKKIHVTE